MATVSTRFDKNVSLYANYQLTYANDLPATPTNPYDFALDYGRSALDRRHNFQLFGSIQAPKGIHLAPFVTIRSGAPYDVLAAWIYMAIRSRTRALRSLPPAPARRAS